MAKRIARSFRLADGFSSELFRSTVCFSSAKKLTLGAQRSGPGARPGHWRSFATASMGKQSSEDANILGQAHAKRLTSIKQRAKSLKRVAITGASSNTGRYLSEILRSANPELHVVNLTNNPNRTWRFIDSDDEPNQDQSDQDQSGTTPTKTDANITVAPLNFWDASALHASLEAVDVLVITYWQRFDVDVALQNLKTLVDAAYDAGVPRVVYISHTKPSVGATDIPYIQAKAEAEGYIRKKYGGGDGGDSAALQRSFGFVRPCCIFSDSVVESVVVNNMAYVVRRAPMMMLSLSSEKQHFQPVHVRDIAEMCADMATRPLDTTGKSSANMNTDLGFLDAVGPEKFTVAEFLRLLAIHASRPFLGVVPRVIVPALPERLCELVVPFVFNRLLGDVWVHSTEMRILHQDIACSAAERDPILDDPEQAEQYWGVRKLSSWVEGHGDALGKQYINTFERYYGSAANVVDVPKGTGG